MHHRIVVGPIATLLIIAVASPLFANQAKKGYTKAAVARASFLFKMPDASSPPPVESLLAGLDGTILENYDDFSLVEINDNDKEKLEERGKQASVLVTLRDIFDKMFLNGKTIDARGDKDAPLAGETNDPLYSKNEQGAWLIQFIGPIRSEWMEQVKAVGIVPVQYIPMHGYIVGGRESMIRDIEKFSFIQWTMQMHRYLKPSRAPRGNDSIELWIELARTDETNDTVAMLRSISQGEVDVAAWSDSETRVQGVFRETDIDSILAQPLVIGLAERPTIGLSDERSALGITRLASAVSSSGGKYRKWLSDLCPSCTHLQDDGFYLGIADSGLDGGDHAQSGTASGEPASTNQHRAELASSRIVWGTSFETTQGTLFNTQCYCPDTTNSKHDVMGHGTLVAGIAAGNPPDNGGKDNDSFFWGLGVAPSAGLVVTKINSGQIGSGATRVLDVTRDARTVASSHAYWQNFSLNQYYNTFGSQSDCSNFYDGAYSILSRDFDAAVRDADLVTAGDQQMTLTVSSGNVSQQGSGQYCQTIDRSLTLPPGTAKNVIAVGGGENDRPDPWLCNSSRADDYTNLAINAKHGTGYQRYFKPDLIAVSSSIASSRTNDAYFPYVSYCNPYPGFPPPQLPTEYNASSGTSFSAPVGLAAAALGSRRFSSSPGDATPALVKAMLVAGSRSMRGGKDRGRVSIWTGGANHILGDRVFPTAFNDHYYEAIAISGNWGTSSTTEPTPWPTDGGTITDGSGFSQITWQDKGSEVTIAGFPNGQQGFGRIALDDVLSDYPMRAFINETQTLAAGQSWTHEYVVHDLSLPVRIALVWTDPPAIFSGNYAPFNTPTLIMNDLDLSVEVKQSGSCIGRYVGNDLSATEESIYYQPCTGGTADTTNNVEVIRFFATPQQPFTVKVVLASGLSQNFALVVWNAYSSDLVTLPPAKPSNFVATGTSGSSVSLSWGSSAGATSYDLQRSSGASDPYVTIATPSDPSYGDSGLSALTTYLYRMRARNGTGVSDWAVDPATTIVFTDPILTAGVTIAKAAHINELRQAASAMRIAAGLPAFPWSDDPILAGTTPIRTTHVADLRAALAQARSTLWLDTLSWTDDPLISQVTIVKKAHIQELRDGVQ